MPKIALSEEKKQLYKRNRNQVRRNTKDMLNSSNNDAITIAYKIALLNNYESGLQEINNRYKDKFITDSSDGYHKTRDYGYSKLIITGDESVTANIKIILTKHGATERASGNKLLDSICQFGFSIKYDNTESEKESEKEIGTTQLKIFFSANRKNIATTCISSIRTYYKITRTSQKIDNMYYTIPVNAIDHSRQVLTNSGAIEIRNIVGRPKSGTDYIIFSIVEPPLVQHNQKQPPSILQPSKKQPSSFLDNILVLMTKINK